MRWLWFLIASIGHNIQGIINHLWLSNFRNKGIDSLPKTTLMLDPSKDVYRLKKQKLVLESHYFTSGPGYGTR